MGFVSIDVETANADVSSICQIGLAVYDESGLCREFETYINPKTYFDAINIDIHGIDEDTVKNAPTFAEAYNEIMSILTSNILVCHTHFDRASLVRACTNSSLEPPQGLWLDSARVARRVWEEFAWSGYGLKNVCKKFNYTFEHHNALEDAKAAGFIINQAIKETNGSIGELIDRCHHPINLDSTKPISRFGNPDGVLFGEVVVFTGALNVLRRDAADMAALIGCNVADNVTKKTTLLVVGDQDISKLAGKEKSSKHLKAEKLIAEGQDIRILSESDFMRMINI